LPQPGRLGHSISHTAILDFDPGPRDSVLALGRSGDEAIPEEHGIAQGGLVGVGTASPVSVRVDNQIELR
jgi:hypothetical protein